MRFKLTEELQTNIEMLRQIRDDNSTPPAVRVQAMQSLIKMMQLQNAESVTEAETQRPTPADIMARIRAEKTTR